MKNRVGWRRVATGSSLLTVALLGSCSSSGGSSGDDSQAGTMSGGGGSGGAPSGGHSGASGSRGSLAGAGGSETAPGEAGASGSESSAGAAGSDAAAGAQNAGGDGGSSPGGSSAAGFSGAPPSPGGGAAGEGGEGGVGGGALLDCAGAVLPSTAPASVTLGGDAVELRLAGVQALGGATITAFNSANTQLAQGTTGIAGDYSLSLATGGAPLLTHVQGSNAGDLDTWFYPGVALTSNVLNVDLPFFTAANREALLTALSTTQTAGKALLLVRAVDCAHALLQAATITVAGVPSSSIFSTATELPGVASALVVNVTPGQTQVSAVASGHPLRTNTVNATADALTVVDVVP